MQKPLVIILGAGAAFGYSETHKPPLTKHLVDPTHFDHNLLRKYEPAADLLSELHGYRQADGDNFNFESRIKEIKDGFGDQLHRRQQLVALQYYLRDKFAKESSRINPINNYKALISRVKDSAIPEVLVINFNYDSLFEDSISGREFSSMDSYFQNSIKILKPHGSHNWAYILRPGIRDPLAGDSTDYEFLMENPGHIEDLKGRGRIRPFHQNQLVGHAEVLKFPAIAIPIAGKQDFICPEEHMQRARIVMQKADKILIIGWKAGDENIISELRQNLPTRFGILVVTDQIENASKIAQKISSLRTGLTASTKGLGGGFSKLFTPEAFNDFLKTDFI